MAVSIAFKLLNAHTMSSEEGMAKRAWVMNKLAEREAFFLKQDSPSTQATNLRRAGCANFGNNNNRMRRQAEQFKVYVATLTSRPFETLTDDEIRRMSRKSGKYSLHY